MFPTISIIVNPRVGFLQWYVLWAGFSVLVRAPRLTPRTRNAIKAQLSLPYGGAVAQLGARLDGIEEVVGSNPIGSTIQPLMPFYIYILQSKTTQRYYVGQTQDLDARLAYHNANYSRALKNRGPWRLVYSEAYSTRRQAVRRERYIKQQKDRRFLEASRSASR
jgi:putative endonuclease